MARILLFQFFISGFCSLLYEIIWLRLGMTAFGSIGPVISTVVIGFMLGIAFGSDWIGRKVESFFNRTGGSAILGYGLVEFGIGAGALVVPTLFQVGERVLKNLGTTDSFHFMGASAVAILIAILPFTFLMGATLPLAIAFVREQWPEMSELSFGYLYASNLFGAAIGAYVTAHYLIELNGFHQTLQYGAMLNGVVGLISILIWVRVRGSRLEGSGSANLSNAALSSKATDSKWTAPLDLRRLQELIFVTGFISLAAEMVWTRFLAVVYQGSVYAFSWIMTIYLIANFAGAVLYRYVKGRRKNLERPAALWSEGNRLWLSLLPLTLLLTEIFADEYFELGSSQGLFLVPFCVIVGFLTPQLVEEVSGGDPGLAGRAYAINLVGCIFGSVLSVYFLLPLVGDRVSLVLLAAAVWIWLILRKFFNRTFHMVSISLLSIVVMIYCVFFARLPTEGPRANVGRTDVRYDSVATVTALQQNNRSRQLLVNGLGMTVLTPITKLMVHFPLSLMEKKAERALVICFGMGTSFRSSLSWGLDTTAVELVPSVVKLFPFFHADTKEVLENPKGRIVIDDGRRFLKRGRDRFDLIVVDPPPPIFSAGSGMLYSKEFYQEVDRRLSDGGIFQQWYPEGGNALLRAVYASLKSVFPYVRAFNSIEGWGVHLLASRQPIRTPALADLSKTVSSKMPALAQKDLLEWAGAQGKIEDFFQVLLSRETDLAQLPVFPGAEEVTDDLPINEYFELRVRAGGG